jgi:hypothetical protein
MKKRQPTILNYVQISKDRANGRGMEKVEVKSFKPESSKSLRLKSSARESPPATPQLQLQLQMLFAIRSVVTLGWGSWIILIGQKAAPGESFRHSPALSLQSGLGRNKSFSACAWKSFFGFGILRLRLSLCSSSRFSPQPPSRPSIFWNTSLL